MASIHKNIIYVAGLPRSGSTLMCQLLGEHPDIYSTGHSSPLANTIKGMRARMSDDPFLLSQLDVDYDLVYQRLTNSYRGFINGWFEETDKSMVVDKNRSWLNGLETLSHLDPNFKMVVCIRDLRQIFASIENRHQKTSLIDFPDDMADLTSYERADKLFSPQGVVGRPLRLIGQLQDVSVQLQKNLYYIIFEDLMNEPIRVMQEVYHWLGADNYIIDPNKLSVKQHESDSYYRFKYPHKTYDSIKPPALHDVTPRIGNDITKEFEWYYKLFYPGLLSP
ncbi:sulfotransferase family protein [Marinicella sediminis]|uniref:Sulfotransferase family protein n=1 Tax=Marinicella sediminis TaxID=1792834 RepID=A0ABV7JBA7_9GAMM|nr:sulfotransferase [Marinicella sediminis]